MENTDTGDRIRIVRKRLGMSQEKLGDKLALSAAAISAYETGGVQPPIPILKKVAELGDVSVEWLIMGKEWTIKTLGEMLSKDEMQLLEAYRRSCEEDRQAILRIAENAANAGDKDYSLK